MDDYEKIEKIGSGSYGIVNKCRHKRTGEVVAIKKFLETEADPQIRKIAVREVKMLKALKHGNLVCLRDVFRRKKKLHMVFEFIDHTLLNEVEKHPKGLPTEMVQKITWQVLSAIEFCHQNDVVHRDVKPENVLVSDKLLVKLCDFGFARQLDGPPALYTDYVATRWYRAPELLVGDVRYDSKVDVWAIGCLFGEMLTGRPVWPGKSDVDQMWRIICTLGETTKRLEHIYNDNPFFTRKIPSCKPSEIITLQARYGKYGPQIVEFMELMLKHSSKDRGSCTDVKAHSYFDGFRDWFMPELEKLFAEPPLTINPPAQDAATVAKVDHDAGRQIGVKQQRAGEGIKQTGQMIDSMTLGAPPAQQQRNRRTHAKNSSQFISLKDPKKRKQKLSLLSNGTKRKPATSLKIFKEEEKSRGFHLPSIGK